MSRQNRYEVLAQRTKAEFPRYRVKRRKDTWWLHAIFWVLSKITRRDYSGFSTTIFSTMYVGETWDEKTSDQQYALLRHEKMHIKQFHCWPLGRWAWPVNHFLTAFCYLLVLPFIFTLRSKFEREGYTQTLLVQRELNGPLSIKRMKRNAEWLADTFGGSTYAWMWRRAPAYEWAMKTQEKINEGEIRNDQDRVDELRAA